MDKETKGSRGTRKQLIPDWIGEPVIVESLAPVAGYQLGVQIFGGNVEETTAAGVVLSGTAGKFLARYATLSSSEGIQWSE